MVILKVKCLILRLDGFQCQSFIVSPKFGSSSPSLVYRNWCRRTENGELFDPDRFPTHGSPPPSSPVVLTPDSESGTGDL